MALINCPECNSSVSDMAPACPNCGFPIQEKQNLPDASPSTMEINAVINKKKKELFKIDDSSFVLDEIVGIATVSTKSWIFWGIIIAGLSFIVWTYNETDGSWLWTGGSIFLSLLVAGLLWMDDATIASSGSTTDITFDVDKVRNKYGNRMNNQGIVVYNDTTLFHQLGFTVNPKRVSELSVGMSPNGWGAIVGGFLLLIPQFIWEGDFVTGLAIAAPFLIVIGWFLRLDVIEIIGVGGAKIELMVTPKKAEELRKQIEKGILSTDEN